MESFHRRFKTETNFHVGKRRQLELNVERVNMLNQYQEYYLKKDDIFNITVFLCFLNSYEFSTVSHVDVVSKRVEQ